MALISAARINNIKARVKAECQRRAFTGSVAAYGGASYDFTTAPANGRTVTKEHYEKNAVPLNAINKNDFPSTSGARVVSDPELAQMEAKLTVYEARAKTDHNGSDCASSCTGLCYGCTGTCWNACTGCTGCGYGCDGVCENNCNYDCYSSCDGCSGGCTSCTNKCDDGCTGMCWFNCLMECVDSCMYSG